MSEINQGSFIYKANAKCDTCQKIFKLVAVYEDEKICLDCLKVRFEEKHKVSPNEFKLDKDSEKIVDKAVDEIIKKK